MVFIVTKLFATDSKAENLKNKVIQQAVGAYQNAWSNNMRKFLI